MEKYYLPNIVKPRKIFSFSGKCSPINVITNKIVCQRSKILSETETKETIGVGVRSLVGVFKGKQNDNYLRILENRSSGPYTGEEKFDLPGIQKNDRLIISNEIKLLMQRRYRKPKYRESINKSNSIAINYYSEF